MKGRSHHKQMMKHLVIVFTERRICENTHTIQAAIRSQFLAIGVHGGRIALPREAKM